MVLKERNQNFTDNHNRFTYTVCTESDGRWFNNVESEGRLYNDKKTTIFVSSFRSGFSFHVRDFAPFENSRGTGAFSPMSHYHHVAEISELLDI